MYAMKLTRDVFEICLTLDPTFAELPASHAIDTYVVLDSKNRIKYVVPQETLQEHFEIKESESFNIHVMKVKKK